MATNMDNEMWIDDQDQDQDIDSYDVVYDGNYHIDNHAIIEMERKAAATKSKKKKRSKANDADIILLDTLLEDEEVIDVDDPPQYTVDGSNNKSTDDPEVICLDDVDEESVISAHRIAKFAAKRKALKEKRDKILQEKQEKEMVEKEKLEKEMVEKEKLEKELREKEKLEKELRDKEKLEKELREKKILEKEKMEKKKAEMEKIEMEKREKEMLHKKKLEEEKLEKKMMKEKLQKEKLQKKLQKEKLEKERLEKEKLEEARNETLVNHKDAIASVPDKTAKAAKKERSKPKSPPKPETASSDSFPYVPSLDQKPSTNPFDDDNDDNKQEFRNEHKQPSSKPVNNSATKGINNNPPIVETINKLIDTSKNVSDTAIPEKVATNKSNTATTPDNTGTDNTNATTHDTIINSTISTVNNTPIIKPKDAIKNKYSQKIKPRVLENKTAAYLTETIETAPFCDEVSVRRPKLRREATDGSIASMDEYVMKMSVNNSGNNVVAVDRAEWKRGLNSVGSIASTDEYSPRVRYSNNNKYTASTDDEEDDNTSAQSDDTKELLHRAHDRIHLQEMQDQVNNYKQVILEKNQEIENLSGQLRRAVSSKCELVIAHTELERHHEYNISMMNKDVKELIKSNYDLMEIRAEIEKEFMNELASLTAQLTEQRQRHLQELDDWERLHRNTVLEKDFYIAQLTEDLRFAQGKYDEKKTSSIPKLLAKMTT